MHLMKLQEVEWASNCFLFLIYSNKTLNVSHNELKILAFSDFLVMNFQNINYKIAHSSRSSSIQRSKETADQKWAIFYFTHQGHFFDQIWTMKTEDFPHFMVTNCDHQNSPESALLWTQTWSQNCRISTISLIKFIFYMGHDGIHKMFLWKVTNHLLPMT